MKLFHVLVQLSLSVSLRLNCQAVKVKQLVNFDRPPFSTGFDLDEDTSKYSSTFSSSYEDFRVSSEATNFRGCHSIKIFPQPLPIWKAYFQNILNIAFKNCRNPNFSVACGWEDNNIIYIPYFMDTWLKRDFLVSLGLEIVINKIQTNIHLNFWRISNR